MADAARRPATYADLLALPDDVRAEIIDGQIVTMPAPLPKHSKPQGALRRYIGGPFDDDDGFGGPGGWWIFLEVDIELGSDVVRPDLSGWRRARLPNPGDERPIRIAPDWVCEILSPSNSTHDRITKRRIYARHRVSYYWIVDPIVRTLEAFALEGERWYDAGSYDETETARIPPFEAVEIPIGRLFLPSPRTEE
ncbi:MAG TPA: Uma2 family endonuclease [Polyangiaceae bacterium]|nr:Uma2 family endonuclease [Polyangiaceae bacterium]